MPIAKCVVTNSASPYTVHSYYPLKAKMKQEGTKKPDTFEAVFPMQNDVDQNYEISYIQDVVDTTWLSAVYPMQLSCLDESGYNQDPTDPAESRFTKVTSGKFKGHYALQFTADAQGVEVPSAKTNKIDISGQFDINIFFTPDTTQLQDGTDEPILWSFRSSTVGLDIGIVGTNGNNSSWKVFLRVDNGSITSGYTGATSGLIMTGAPVHIRVKRGSDNLLKAFVNGVEDISQSVTQSLQPSGTAMVFGDTETSTSDEYKGLIHEIKVYCGDTLSDMDATRVWTTKPISQYMKFNGRVRKLESNQVSKKAVCQSNSYQITTFKLGSVNSSTPDDHPLGSTSFKTIAQSSVDEASSGIFTIRNIDPFAFVSSGVYTPLTGSIYEIGSVVEFINILLTYSDCIMYFTPRKNIIIESDAGHATDYVFDQNSITQGCNIKSSESNDTKLVTQVVIVARSGLAVDRRITPTDGITRTLRRNVRQLGGGTGVQDIYELAQKSLESLSGKYKNRYSVPYPKYVVKSMNPIHHTRYNHTVLVKRKNGNNANVTGITDNDLSETLTVRQIEWNYPSGKTVINLGENDIDYYDSSIIETKRTEELVDTGQN
jgi:hypothetical protein